MPSLRTLLDDDEVVFVDTRAPEHSKGAVPGSLNIPAEASFATWASWIIDPEKGREADRAAGEGRGDARPCATSWLVWA